MNKLSRINYDITIGDADDEKMSQFLYASKWGGLRLTCIGVGMKEFVNKHITID